MRENERDFGRQAIYNCDQRSTNVTRRKKKKKEDWTKAEIEW